MQKSEFRRRLFRALANAIGLVVVMAILDLFTDFRWATVFVVAPFVAVIEFVHSAKKPVSAPSDGSQP